MKKQKNIKLPSKENSGISTFSRLLYAAIIICCLFLPLFKPASSEIDKIDATITKGIDYWLGEDWVKYKVLITESASAYMQDSSIIHTPDLWHRNTLFGFGDGINTLGASMQMMKVIQLNYFSPLLTYSTLHFLLLLSQLFILLFSFQMRFFYLLSLLTLIMNLLIFFVAIRDPHFEPVNWGFFTIILFLSIPLLFGIKKRGQ